MYLPAEPDRPIYHGDEREYVPAIRHTVFPGCAFEVAESTLAGLPDDEPLPVPLGEAYNVHGKPLEPAFDTTKEWVCSGERFPAASAALTLTLWAAFDRYDFGIAGANTVATVFDPQTATVRVYRRADGQLVLASELTGDSGSMLESPLLPGASLSLARIFARVR